MRTKEDCLRLYTHSITSANSMEELFEIWAKARLYGIWDITLLNALIYGFGKFGALDTALYFYQFAKERDFNNMTTYTFSGILYAIGNKINNINSNSDSLISAVEKIYLDCIQAKKYDMETCLFVIELTKALLDTRKLSPEKCTMAQTLLGKTISELVEFYKSNVLYSASPVAPALNLSHSTETATSTSNESQTASEKSSASAARPESGAGTAAAASPSFSTPTAAINSSEESRSPEPRRYFWNPYHRTIPKVLCNQRPAITNTL